MKGLGGRCRTAASGRGHVRLGIDREALAGRCQSPPASAVQSALRGRPGNATPLDPLVRSLWCCRYAVYLTLGLAHCLSPLAARWIACNILD